MKLFSRQGAVIAAFAAITPALTLVWAQDAKTEPAAAAAPATQKKKGGGGGRAPTPYTKAQAPAQLPGKGLMQHDFLYAGQQGFTVAIVRGGKVVWRYHPTGPEDRGEITDASLLADGNVLFTHATALRIVSPDQQIVWQHKLEPQHEVHGAQVIGADKVIFVQNGVPAKVIVMNYKTNTVLKEFEVPVANATPAGVHQQIRRLRLTPAGTVLVAHQDANRVAEYDENGKEVWSAKVEAPYSVERLKNGNTLVNTVPMVVKELNPQGEVVWQFSKDDMPEYVSTKWQVATRLPNGNTLINNEGRYAPAMGPEEWAPVQAVEISPDKKIVWALRSWTGDNALTSSTTIQILDAPWKAETLHFGSFK